MLFCDSLQVWWVLLYHTLKTLHNKYYNCVHKINCAIFQIENKTSKKEVSYASKKDFYSVEHTITREKHTH